MTDIPDHRRLWAHHPTGDRRGKIAVMYPAQYQIGSNGADDAEKLEQRIRRRHALTHAEAVDRDAALLNAIGDFSGRHHRKHDISKPGLRPPSPRWSCADGALMCCLSATPAPTIPAAGAERKSGVMGRKVTRRD